MTDVFTLADIDKALNDKYAPLVFQAGKKRFELRQILRLSSSEREAVVTKLEGLQETPDDEMTEEMVLDVMSFVLSLVAADGAGPELIEVLGSDLLRMKMLFERWMEDTQAGEAQASSV